jgi:N-acetyltransferase 10
MLDYHVILDMMPTISHLHFTGALKEHTNITGVQAALLMAIGLQRKTLESIETELNLPSAQVLAMFQKVIRKVATCFRNISSQAIAKTLPAVEVGRLQDGEIADAGRDGQFAAPIKQKLEEELQEGGEDAMQEIKKKQKELINQLDLSK